jgi:hypothetical protein
MNFVVLEKKYAIYKFSHEADLPDWVYSSDFYSITKTKDELSVVAVQTDNISGDILYNSDWRIIKISGPLDLSITGIIADIADILKNNNIPIFTISTYETDYIMIKEKDLDSGLNALRKNGHNFSFEEHIT